jgi:DNA-directed RNA polymerase specialized sigma24 family protein
MSLDEIMHDEPKIPDATMVDARPNPEQAFRQMENRSTVVGAIHQLSPSLRSALHLRYLQGFSIKEAAELEGVSTAVMKSRSLRARRQLASRLHVREMRSRLHRVDGAVAQRTLALPEPSRLPGLRGTRKG